MTLFNDEVIIVINETSLQYTQRIITNETKTNLSIEIKTIVD